MHLKHYFVYLFFYIYSQFKECSSVNYINTERPVVTSFNKQYINNLTLTSQRLYRKNPRHYVSLYIDTVLIFDNRVKVSFYFYEYVQVNTYRRSFFEMHFKFCDMVNKDPIFGSQIKNQLNLKNQTCPLPPGQYLFKEMAIPFVPESFPFQRGRIYCNATLETSSKHTTLGEAYIEMEILHMDLKKNN